MKQLHWLDFLECFQLQSFDNDFSFGSSWTNQCREEIEKQKAKAHYMKLHYAGKTDQAKADLARLAIIRREREEAAKKKESEKKGNLVNKLGFWLNIT